MQICLSLFRLTYKETIVRLVREQEPYCELPRNFWGNKKLQLVPLWRTICTFIGKNKLCTSIKASSFFLLFLDKLFSTPNLTLTDSIMQLLFSLLSPLSLSECKIENCEACFNRNFCTKCKEGLYSHRGRCYVTCPPDQRTANDTMECIGT